MTTLKMELGKALKNKFFYLALLIGCAITLVGSVEFISSAYEQNALIADIETRTGFHYYKSTDVATPFARWIGTETFSQGSAIFYFVFPLLIAIPFGWSYCAERRNGYEKNVVIRSGKTCYYLSKYAAIFVSGGLAMVIPLIFSFATLAMFLPIATPNVYNMIYHGIFHGDLMSDLYYGSPFVYVFCKLILAFISCGLIACFSYTASLFTKNRLVVTLFPFALMTAFHYATNFIAAAIFPSLKIPEIVPINFLRGQRAHTTFAVLGVEALILLVLTLGVIFVRGKKNEIY